MLRLNLATLFLSSSFAAIEKPTLLNQLDAECVVTRKMQKSATEGRWGGEQKGLYAHTCKNARGLVPTACIGTLQKKEHIKYYNFFRTGTTYTPVLEVTYLLLLLVHL